MRVRDPALWLSAASIIPLIMTTTVQLRKTTVRRLKATKIELDLASQDDVINCVLDERHGRGAHAGGGGDDGGVGRR